MSRRPALESGAVLAGRYRLISELGRGGMGAVWLAEHMTLHSRVAIKVIDSGRVASAGAIGRFIREAQAAAALHSPHVVHVFDFGEDQGVPYIAMELLDGESLAQRLRRVGKLTPAETCEVVTQIARALAKAHEAGIVHRDLKPDNLFLVKNEDATLVKVLDFGIAKATEGGLKAAAPETETGAILGTPFYMSPEQIEGSREVDHRTDLWALALIVYECLLGTRVFESSKLGELILQICVRPIPVPSLRGAVPDGFDEWFARGAAREREARFASARELAESFRALVSGQKPRIVVTPAGLADPLEKTQQAPDRGSGDAPFQALTTGKAVVAQSHPTQRTRSTAFATGLGVAAVLVIGVLVFLGFGDRRREQRDEGRDGGLAAEDAATASGKDSGVRPAASSSPGLTDAGHDARVEPASRDAGAPDVARPEKHQQRRIDWGI